LELSWEKLGIRIKRRSVGISKAPSETCHGPRQFGPSETIQYDLSTRIALPNLDISLFEIGHIDALDQRLIASGPWQLPRPVCHVPLNVGVTTTAYAV